MSDKTAGSNVGQGIGDAVKGIFKTAHGAGEAIRGNINDALDKAGEGVARGGNSTTENVARDAELAAKGSNPNDNANVAQKGADEVKEGLGQLGNIGNKN